MRLVWENMGNPPHKYNTSKVAGYCACCGVKIEGDFALSRDVLGTTFGRYTGSITFGTHICNSCAWFCSFPKQTHRNVIAAGNDVWWPMISRDSATEERPSWFDVLYAIKEMKPDTPVIGVATTDPKPRLWPTVQEMTVGNFGLYVHHPDFDVSDFFKLNINRVIDYSIFISELLSQGFSKKSCFFSVLNDIKKVKKMPLELLETEKILKKMRGNPEFILALLISSKKTNE